MPIFMIIALDIVITLRFSINYSTVICSPTVIFSILREATSETYGPRVYFPSYKFLIYNFSFQFTSFAIFYFPIYKPKIPKIFTLPFIYLYQISLVQVIVKGLTTPLSRWVQVCLIVCAGIRWFVHYLLLDWYIGSQNEGNTYLYFAASPFPLQGKLTQAQDVARRISSAVDGEIFAQVKTYQVRITKPSPSHLHYLTFASRFPLPPLHPCRFIRPLFPNLLLSFLLVVFLFACVLDYLLSWRKIIPNCVFSRIPIIMISLVLRLLLLMMLSLVKSILLCWILSWKIRFPTFLVKMPLPI